MSEGGKDLATFKNISKFSVAVEEGIEEENRKNDNINLVNLVFLKKEFLGNFLVVQWLRLELPMQKLWVLSWIRELKSHMLCNMAKILNGNPFQYSCLEDPWMEEPGRLQSMVSQRLRHD